MALGDRPDHLDLGVLAARHLHVEIGERVELSRFELEAVPAAREELAPGYVGYVVRCGDLRVLHSGDTVAFEGMAEGLRRFERPGAAPSTATWAT